MRSSYVIFFTAFSMSGLDVICLRGGGQVLNRLLQWFFMGSSKR